MKKKVIVIMLLLVVAAVAAGLFWMKKSEKASSAKVNEKTENTEDTGEDAVPTLGFACSDVSDPYFAALQKMLVFEAEKEGYSLVTKNAESDVETQIQQIQELIDAGVELVFLSPVDWQEIAPALTLLQEAGIPIVNIDTIVRNTDAIHAFVGSDNREAGALCGEDLLERCPDGGRVAIIESSHVSAVLERITGFEKKIAKKGFEIVARVDIVMSQENGKAAMEEILAKQPDVDIVMCANDQVALGAMEAAKKAGKDDLIIYGVDGSPEFKEALSKANTLLAGTAAQSPIGIGEASVKVAMKILSGKEYKQETYIDSYLINRENVSLYGVDGWQ